jgi:hypothetical protein
MYYCKRCKKYHLSNCTKKKDAVDEIGIDTIPELSIQGNNLFNKKSQKIIRDKYTKIGKLNSIQSNGRFTGGYFSATISIRDLDAFKREYKREMRKFVNSNNIIYNIPEPDVERHTRIAKVSIHFTRSNIFSGYAKNNVLHPITEYERRIAFDKAKAILCKYRRDCI